MPPLRMGSAPNFDALTGLRFPTLLLQTDGAQFLLYDSGPYGAKVVISGPPECVRALGRAHVWRADGTFKPSPRFRTHVYTTHARCIGLAIPCAYALLPNKAAATYAAMRAKIRANIGKEAADVDRLVTMDIEVGPIGAAFAAFPGMKFKGCYFHLWQSARRQVQKIAQIRCRR